MAEVMIDIETLGTGNDAVILSIGATKFSDQGILDTFYVTIDPASCQQHGLTIDAGTVMWWMGEDKAEARKALIHSPNVDLYTALDGFAEWFGKESVPVWGNGATFDNVILRSAYGKTNIPCPWKFWHDRCYRTMKNLVPGITMDRKGIHHSAIDDAVDQTNHLLAIKAAMHWDAIQG